MSNPRGWSIYRRKELFRLNCNRNELNPKICQYPLKNYLALDQNDSLEQDIGLPKSETEPKIEEENLKEKPNIDQKDGCEEKNCRKFYGRQKHLWCKQCTAVASVKKPPKKYKRTIPQIKPYLLCLNVGKMFKI